MPKLFEVKVEKRGYDKLLNRFDKIKRISDDLVKSLQGLPKEVASEAENKFEKDPLGQKVFYSDGFRSTVKIPIIVKNNKESLQAEELMKKAVKKKEEEIKVKVEEIR